MNLILLIKIDDNEYIKEFDYYFEITLEVNCIYRKEAKGRGRGAYCYLPLELAGEDILIFESPY